MVAAIDFYPLVIGSIQSEFWVDDVYFSHQPNEDPNGSIQKNPGTIDGNKSNEESRDDKSQGLIESIDTDDGLIVFPNPTNGIITIVAKTDNLEHDLVIRDTRGSVVYTSIAKGNKPEARVELDASNWEAGIYIIEWTFGTSSRKARLLKH